MTRCTDRRVRSQLPDLFHRSPLKRTIIYQKTGCNCTIIKLRVTSMHACMCVTHVFLLRWPGHLKRKEWFESREFAEIEKACVTVTKSASIVLTTCLSTWSAQQNSLRFDLNSLEDGELRGGVVRGTYWRHVKILITSECL